MFLLAAIFAAVMQLQPGDTAICNTSVAPTAKPTSAPTSAPPSQPSPVPTPAPPLVTGDRLFITHSGTYDGHGAGIKGADIYASNVTLQNYDISTQANGNNGYGVYVHGNIDHVTIANNNIHDLCRDAVFMENGVSYVTVRGNTIVRASMSGVNINGQHNTADDNDISQMMQYPRRKGGIFSVCKDESGADADGFRFFGSDHLIANNRIHDIDFGTTVNVDPHVDCFQTWGTGSSATQNITISGNHCWWAKTSNNTDNEFSSIEALNGAVGNITYKNNVFQEMRQGCNIGRGVGPVIFDHNTTDNILQQVLIFETNPTNATKITNNIFYRHGGGADGYSTSLAPTMTNNNCTGPNGNACGSYPVNDPATALNPMFVSVGAASAADNNYNLQPTSPVPTAGAFPLR